MEELFELRSYLEQQRYPDALRLLGEMDEMSRDDKVNKICSVLSILLLHLIKQHAEQRTTRSWNVAIANARREIQRVNKRRKAGGTYLSREELAESIHETYPEALTMASLEAFGGAFEEEELATKVDRRAMEHEALTLLGEVHA